MRHPLSKIISKETDYKICISHTEDFGWACGALNWYENEDCRTCGGSEFRPATCDDVNDFALDYSLPFDDDEDYADIYAEVS